MSRHEACASSSPWPEDERAIDVCGSEWQDAYAKVHARQLAAANPRIAVFSAVGNGGLADRLTGLMTVLLVAILTDRAIAIDWNGYEKALKTPRVDAFKAMKLARAAVPSDVRRLQWLNANRVALRNLTESVSGGLDELWPERVLVFQTNRGFTQGLLDSTVHARAVSSRRLNGTNAQFGCLFNFLLRPTSGSLTRVAPLTDAITAAKARGDYIVGVHVRTGDQTFSRAAADGAGGAAAAADSSGIEKLYASLRFIFEYAERLGRERIAHVEATQAAQQTQMQASRQQEQQLSHAPTPSASPSPAGRQVRFVLLGDSPALRRHAAAVYGRERVLYYGGDQDMGGTKDGGGGGSGSAGREGVAIGHVAKQLGANEEEKLATLQSAVGEHWAYSGCDAFVYSSHSGYPRTAAARAMRDDAIHTCFHYSGRTFNPQPTARECTGPHSVAALGERHAAGL